MSTDDGNGKSLLPFRKLALPTDPTRRDAGLGRIGITILFDPVTKDIQVQGAPGLDIIGIMGILELAKVALVQSNMRKPT